MIGISINGCFLTAERLEREDGVTLLGEEEWQVAICIFLKAWFSTDPFIEMRSSGSTGDPKLFTLPKQMMRQSARATNLFFALTQGDTLLLCLSADYIAGKMMLVRALEGGLRVTAVPPTSTPPIPKDSTFQLCAMVPMQVEQLLRKGDEDLFKGIEQLIIGGGEVIESLRGRLQQLPTRCYATYGMTETASHVALSLLHGSQSEMIYRALSGVEFEVDERDCLIINAPNLLTQALITNDVVALVDRYSFKWIGRADFVVNSGGVKLFPESIERKIAHLFDRLFYLTKESDPLLGERLVLVVEGEPLSSEEACNLLDLIRSTCNRYEVPKRIVYRKELPETATGKLMRIL